MRTQNRIVNEIPEDHITKKAKKYHDAGLSLSLRVPCVIRSVTVKSLLFHQSYWHIFRLIEPAIFCARVKLKKIGCAMGMHAAETENVVLVLILLLILSTNSGKVKS